jgi:hypothetical protein
MPVMQESSELFAQRLVALVVVAGDDGLFEQQVLDVLRQSAPGLDHRLAERQGKPIVFCAHVRVLVSAANSLRRGTVPRAFRPARFSNICISSKAHPAEEPQV